MKANSAPSTASVRKPGLGHQVLREALLVAVLGLVFAAIANQFSPRGLVLSRDYFPGAPQPALTVSTTGRQSQSAEVTNATPRGPASTLETIAARLRLKGLQLIGSNQVLQLFHDPRYQQELVVFVDARNDREYQEGHVPGAYPFDRYHPENFLPALLPVCQTAERIVVYCHGGDCEDSEFAAETLANVGIPSTNLLVYGGGFTEWSTNGLPVEIGARLSGNLRAPNP